ncbi:MAG: polysaccharide biosynthesis tyrosine autokinase [Deltaproteobacteria bacterium]|nr:polysaccharide biosynthesis tyrosine autokinase [Deltaproteobacteria bacterium]
MAGNLPVQSNTKVAHIRSSYARTAYYDLPGQDNELQLRQYWRTIVKYRTVIAGCSALSLVVALIYIFTTPPRYTASAKLSISSYQPALASTKIEDMLQYNSRDASYFDTQIQEIRSFSLADQVLRDHKIKEYIKERFKRKGLFSRLFGSTQEQHGAAALGGLNHAYHSTMKEIEDYLSLVSVSPIRRTTLVTVNATLESPELAAYIANKHALEYIDWVRAKRIEQQSRGLVFLQGQAAELREKVSAIEREIADYAEANSIVAVNKDENITVQKMSQLNGLLTQAVAKAIEFDNQHKQAEAALKNNSAGMDDSSVQAMRAELGKLEAEREQLSAKFTDSYPRMVQITSQIDMLKSSIRNQRMQIVEGLKAKALAAKEEETRLREELEQQKSHAFELSKSQVQYNVLNRELTASRELLQNILAQIKETSVAVENNSSNVGLVDHAMVPISPSYPRKKLILFAALIFGGAVGVGLAFLMGYLDDTIRTPDELVEQIELAKLGVVPNFDLEFSMLPEPQPGEGQAILPEPPAGEGPQGKEGEMLPSVLPAFVQHPHSLAAEAYRTIRTALLLSQAGEPPRTLLVTSAQSSEGKTTSAVNLAASFAGSGGRVLLIDADLRRPSVHRHFNLSSEKRGVVDILTGQCCISECVVSDVVPNVSVIVSGRIPPNPAELLGSIQMFQMISEASELYDYVIIDSPPVLPVTDSVVLSRNVDGVMLVVKAGATPRKVIIDARDRLTAVGARVLGAVLNDVDFTRAEYYYYNRYYHSYYAAEAPNQEAAAG